MGGMNCDTFNSIKNDAVRRTREMHSRSQCSGCNDKRCYEKRCHNEERCAHNEKKKSTGQSGKSNSSDSHHGGSNGISDILNSIRSMLSGKNEKLDSDTLIIILFIIILAKDGADIKLLLALGYILM